MDNSGSAHQWFVAHTQPQREDLAAFHLRQQGYEVFLPKCHKVRMHARKKEVVLRPLFPRYLFVYLNLMVDPWISVDSTRGVAYILRNRGSEPIPMPEGVIAELRAAQTGLENIVPLSSLHIFKPGEKVEITEGAFSGNTAVYEKMTEGERVQLLMNLLGRDIRLELSVHQVVSS